jgi:putative intracellular protease/amidase
MMKPTVYVFLFDDFIDWEVAYVMPGLIHSGKAKVATFSLDGKKVVSAGGLKIRPDMSKKEVKVDENAILILPGGVPWEEKKITGMDNLVKQFLDEGMAVGAICAATTYLGQLGALEEVTHTSNGLNYLKEYVPDYQGESLYVDVPAVQSGKVVTASGTSAVEFAKEIFSLTRVYTEEEIEEWYLLYRM